MAVKVTKCVALSTIEAKFIPITKSCEEMLWVKQFLHELGQEQEKYIAHCDSMSAVHVSKNLVFTRDQNTSMYNITRYMMYWNPSNCNLRKFIMMIIIEI